MAKYATFIADPELELLVLEAINAVGGELSTRGVSLDQIRDSERDPNITLISNRMINFANNLVVVDRSMSQPEIIDLLKPKNEEQNFYFDKRNSSLISFVGLNGGVGTTSLAINYAFEKSISNRVLLADLNMSNPDIAVALGLHRIENKPVKVTNHLSAIQGQPRSTTSELLIFDLGPDLTHPAINISDQVFLVARIGANTLSRLRKIDFLPSVIIFNFSEASKYQDKWRREISAEFPRLKWVEIPLDSRSFECAADSKSALMEVAGNSRARKSIATLG